MNTFEMVPDLDEPIYRGSPGWSISQRKLLPTRPELFRGFFIADPPEYEFDWTAGMLLGVNVHADFLEGAVCREIPRDVLTSNGQRRGGKWEAFKACHPAIECLNAKEMAAVRGIRKSLESQPILADLLWGEGPTELSIFGRDAETGLDEKGRLDKLRTTKGGLIIGDLKITTVDPDDERAVQKQIYAMGYVKQLANYWDLVANAAGEEPQGAVLVLGRNKPPFTARGWPLSDVDLDWGRRHNREAWRDLRRRLDTNNWTSERHNRILPGPDGNLLPSCAFKDENQADNSGRYAEFDDFAESDNSSEDTES